MAVFPTINDFLGYVKHLKKNNAPIQAYHDHLNHLLSLVIQKMKYTESDYDFDQIGTENDVLGELRRVTTL